MKATKKIGLGICVTGILLTGILMAQGASSSEASTSITAASGSASTDATSATSTSTADSTTDWTAIIDSDPNTSQLVLVIESDGDLDEVAEAMYLTGTDTLISTMPEGVTIFAPVDGSFDQDVAVEDVITSYIIPGIVDTADMASGDSTTSTAISGDPLTIAVVNEVVTVNGVPVLDAEAIYTDNAVIYKLSDSFASNDLASTK